MIGDDSALWPGWRSLLFVPAGESKRVRKAAECGADAVILDLEDSVAEADRPAARAGVPALLGLLRERGVDALVRVNPGALDLVHDLEACVRPGLAAVMLPKLEAVARLALVDELLTALEAPAGLVPGGIGMVGLIESAAGLLAAPELARANRRLWALAIGPEDLALDLGGEPDAELLTEPARRIAWAARAADRTAVGFPGPISNFRDMPRLRDGLARARALGYAAALCIHPAQLEICHEAFAITAEQAEQAQRVVDAFAAAEREGKAVCALDGRMIDRPVVQRARAVLARWQRQRRDGR